MDEPTCICRIVNEYAEDKKKLQIRIFFLVRHAHFISWTTRVVPSDYAQEGTLRKHQTTSSTTKGLRLAESTIKVDESPSVDWVDHSAAGWRCKQRTDQLMQVHTQRESGGVKRNRRHWKSIKMQKRKERKFGKGTGGDERKPRVKANSSWLSLINLLEINLL